ncbi:hypothetical protein C8035_v007158 [Colletotrichum spinosum]|uniref:Secreted protein n=1 Tax=Colletotrichum spinosum TaxID=1347390 RepID=A0A4R8QAV8_9PEZI|nr:hypothetical protein C8035_v007158 [Colletotrichum spinosum]
MVSFKTILIATLISSIAATPLSNRTVGTDNAPLIASREKDRDCDSDEKSRLDNQIRNRQQMKSRLDDEIERRQNIKTKLEQDIRTMQNNGNCNCNNGNW